jgi:BirA family biotin operon repressor/biotin-[acetyl-CoA-carboxylase] ligase
MTSPWSDLDRPPLSPESVVRALSHTRWNDVRVLSETASTNAVVADAARAGAPAGLVVVAERQTAGRGRQGRGWEAPARSGLTFSVLLRPIPPRPAWSLLPLLVGTAVAEAVVAVAGLEARLKWPNDVLAPGGRKLAGVLTELVDEAVVAGVGLNVTTREDELPVATATSLAIEGAPTDRLVLLAEVLRALDRRYTAWEAGGGAPRTVLPAYREICESIGQRVRVELPGSAQVEGVVVRVDDDGRLVVREDGVERAWSAGDVVHLRGVGG